jgi:hypothetical protein
MVRSAAVLVFFTIPWATALAWLAPGPGDMAQPKREAADRLQDTVNSEGFDDPKFTLQNAFEYLMDRYEISIDVNEHAFADLADRDDEKSVLDFEIAQKPIPKMFNATLEQVVRKILSRLPARYGATYLIRGNRIEITTSKAAAKEILGNEDLPLPPLVTKKIDKRLLSDALEDVSSLTGVSVVLDVSVAEGAKKPVSAKLMNVPIDTAVKLLADMADLGTLRIDNAIYVTTRDKAKRLREEQQQGTRKEKAMPRAEN